MRHALAIALLGCALATVAAPAAQAARPCGPGIDVNCSTGTEACRVFVGQLRTCL